MDEDNNKGGDILHKEMRSESELVIK